MKRMNLSHWLLGLTVVCLLLVGVACGPKEPTIETPAKDMNLTAADLGSDWVLQNEQGLSDLPEKVGEYFRDANVRTFAAEGKGMVVSQVLRAPNARSVQKAIQEVDPIESFTSGLKEDWPDATFEEVTPPDIGEDTAMATGKMSYMDINFTAWMVVFRKHNVTALVAIVGTEEASTEEVITDYARKLEAKIH